MGQKGSKLSYELWIYTLDHYIWKVTFSSANKDDWALNNIDNVIKAL